MIANLGIWARVALASRCAERVLPLYTLTFRFDAASQREVSDAVALSREMATVGPTVVKTVTDALAVAAELESRQADVRAVEAAHDAKEALDASALAAGDALKHDAMARSAADTASRVVRDARAFVQTLTEGYGRATDAEEASQRTESSRAGRTARSAANAADAADARADRVQAHANVALEIASRAAEAARVAAVRAADAAMAAREVVVKDRSGPSTETVVTEAAAAAVAASSEAALSAALAVANSVSSRGSGFSEQAMPGATTAAVVWDADWLRQRVVADALVPAEFFERPLWPDGQQSRCGNWQEVVDACRLIVDRACSETNRPEV